MKNIFKLLAVTALAGIAAASCTKDLNGTAEGNEATVSFSVTSPLIGTKAIADGNTVDKVACYIYDEADNHIAALDKTVGMNGGKATFSATLVTGKTYKFLFWAYKEGVSGYTVNAGNKTLTVDYSRVLANDESRDAFYNYVASYKVTGDKTEEIKLKRPFAQINFGVTAAEWEAFEKAGGAVTKTGIKVSGAANVLNFTDGSVTDFADVVFAANTIPAESEKLSVSGTDYRYLATTYVLAGKSQSSIHNITLTKEGLDGDIIVPNAPLQGNWRTNITGSLLTSTTNFNIVVEPGFEGNNNEDLKNISTTSALQALFVNGGSATLKEDIEISEPLVLAAGKSAVLNLNGKKITNKGTDAAIRVSGNLEINGEGSVYGGTGGDNVAVWAAQGGKVTINGGEYSVGKDANGLANSCVYAYGGDIVINGGTFSSEQPWNGKYYVLNKNNSTPQSTITVTSGTFINYDPSTGDDSLGGSFVASGYQSTKVSDNPATYVVTKQGVTPVTSQEGLNAAITGATKGSPVTIQLLANATYTLDNGIAHEGDKSRNITFIGDGTQTVDIITKATSAENGMLNYQRGSSFTFKNLKIKAGEGSFDGIVCDELIYEDCTISGKLTFYGKATFKNCTFENTMANQYSIWTWGGTDVNFDGCTFNTNGKAILLYGQATEAKPTNLTVENCTFEDRNNGTAGKAAIEIGNDSNATYSLVVNNCTVNGFAEGKNTNSKIWANKNSMDAGHLSVTIDGTKVQ